MILFCCPTQRALHKNNIIVSILKIIGLGLAICFSAITVSQAQEGWEVGGYAGLAKYTGDLSPRFSLRQPGAALGFFARRNFDGRLCFRIAGSFANIGGSDKTSIGAFEKARNLSFRSNVFELSAVVEFNFQDFHNNTRDEKPVSPYLLAGLGFFHFNPTATYDGVRYSLQTLGTEGQARGEEYNLVTGAVLLGGGIKIDMNPYISWNIEMTGRMTFTDYLDDVRGVYGDPNAIAAYHGDVAAALSDRSVELGERIGRPGRQRGDSKGKDAYMFFTVGIAYRFMPLVCPAY